MDLTGRDQIKAAQWDWLHSVPFWYCGAFPLDLIPPRRRGANRHADLDWFTRMVQDIDANGIRSPVVLNNSPIDPFNTFPERENFSVRAGNHRVSACRALHHETIEALVWGHAPRIFREIGVLNVDDANLFIKDGHLEMHWHGPVLVGASNPKEEFSG